MTCTEAAAVFERAVAERLAKKSAVPMALRFKQMARIAKVLREHGDEDRFTDDIKPLLAKADSLQLMMIEWATMSWWPKEQP